MKNQYEGKAKENCNLVFNPHTDRDNEYLTTLIQHNDT
jgi:hypothetical protein